MLLHFSQLNPQSFRSKDLFIYDVNAELISIDQGGEPLELTANLIPTRQPLHQPLTWPEENYLCFSQSDSVCKDGHIVPWATAPQRVKWPFYPSLRTKIGLFCSSIFSFVPFCIERDTPLWLWPPLLFVGEVVAINYCILWLQLQNKMKLALL